MGSANVDVSSVMARYLVRNPHKFEAAP
jgi:hypothetical protein